MDCNWFACLLLSILYVMFKIFKYVLNIVLNFRQKFHKFPAKTKEKKTVHSFRREKKKNAQIKNVCFSHTLISQTIS